MLLFLGYKFRKHGFNFAEWGPEKSDDLSNTVRVTDPKRKGRLEFPDDDFTWANVMTFVDWIWVWMK